MNRESQGLPQLRLLFWESTVRCNLACIHCRRTDAADTADDDLTTGEVRAVFDSAATLGRPIVVFSGGEPLLRSDWEVLANYARSLNLPTALATNGTLIDAALARRVAAADFSRASVSLDGADAATHDTFRGAAGAFDKALAGIGELKRLGVAVQINTTIAAHNVHQCEALYELARSLGAVALHLFLLVPVGCGTKIAETHRITPEQYERVLNWICDRRTDQAIELRATCAPHFYRVAAQRGT
ncbi:MAG: radical SAM protein, partial [Phycisphaerae bacterium]|nr:radical SAM protein [Phycisphaerae bacterium]